MLHVLSTNRTHSSGNLRRNPRKRVQKAGKRKNYLQEIIPHVLHVPSQLETSGAIPTGAADEYKSKGDEKFISNEI